MSGEGQPAPLPASFDRVLYYIVNTVEEHINSLGWDQPASLWSVNQVPSSDVLPIFEFGGPAVHGENAESFDVAFAIDLVSELHGDPVEALIGRRIQGENCVGAIFVSEGFYGEIVDGTRAETSNRPKREVRIVHLALTDGTEALVHRDRSSGATTVEIGSHTGVELTGYAVWFLRRCIGLPTRADTASRKLPSVEELRRRVRAAICAGLSLLPQMDEESSFDSAVSAVEALLERSISHMGLTSPDWEQARQRALASARTEFNVGDPTRDGAELLDFLEWCDGPLWADRLDNNVPELEESREAISESFRYGNLSAALREWLRAELDR